MDQLFSVWCIALLFICLEVSWTMIAEAIENIFEPQVAAEGYRHSEHVHGDPYLRVAQMIQSGDASFQPDDINDQRVFLSADCVVLLIEVMFREATTRAARVLRRDPSKDEVLAFFPSIAATTYEHGTLGEDAFSRYYIVNVVKAGYYGTKRDSSDGEKFMASVILFNTETPENRRTQFTLLSSAENNSVATPLRLCTMSWTEERRLRYCSFSSYSSGMDHLAPWSGLWYHMPFIVTEWDIQPDGQQLTSNGTLHSYRVVDFIKQTMFPPQLRDLDGYSDERNHVIDTSEWPGILVRRRIRLHGSEDRLDYMATMVVTYCRASRRGGAISTLLNVLFLKYGERDTGDVSTVDFDVNHLRGMFLSSVDMEGDSTIVYMAYKLPQRRAIVRYPPIIL